MLLPKYFRLAGKLTIGLLLLIPCASAIEIAVSYLLQLITDSVTGHANLAYGSLVRWWWAISCSTPLPTLSVVTPSSAY